MKSFFLLILSSLFLFSCKPTNNDQATIQELQTQIDSLKNGLLNTYKPNLGEFMLNIQIHHSKLWFAGQNKNWKLAQFELDAINEVIKNIQQYCKNRPDVNSIEMIKPSISNLKHAIIVKNSSYFSKSFQILTETCNNCHRSTKQEFNEITIPNGKPFSNQKF